MHFIKTMKSNKNMPFFFFPAAFAGCFIFYSLFYNALKLSPEEHKGLTKTRQRVPGNEEAHIPTTHSIFILRVRTECALL